VLFFFCHRKKVQNMADYAVTRAITPEHFTVPYLTVEYSCTVSPGTPSSGTVAHLWSQLTQPKYRIILVRTRPQVYRRWNPPGAAYYTTRRAGLGLARGLLFPWTSRLSLGIIPRRMPAESNTAAAAQIASSSSRPGPRGCAFQNAHTTVLVTILPSSEIDRVE
jgi:hypothetical protein